MKDCKITAMKDNNEEVEIISIDTENGSLIMVDSKEMHYGDLSFDDILWINITQEIECPDCYGSGEYGNSGEHICCRCNGSGEVKISWKVSQS